MHHVRVQEVGTFLAHGRDERRGEACRHIAAARNASPGHRALVERPVKPLGVAAGVEREEARIDTALAQGRKQREQMLLGAADPLHLRRVQHLHASRILRYRRSTSSTIRCGREPIAHPACAFGAQPRAQSGIGAQSLEVRGERRNVADRRQEPRLAVVDHRAGAARRRRDDRHAGGERLDRNDRSALVGRRQEKRVERGVPRAEVVDVAEKPNALGDTEGLRELLDLGSELPVSGQHQHRLGQQLQHANQITGTLDLGQPPGPTDHERIAEPGCGASSLTGLRRRVDPSVEVEPVRDDDELGTRRDAEAHEVVAHLVAHRDECVGRVRERTFREPIRPLAPRSEVPTQDVAVVGVHDCAGPRAAGNERGHTAGGAGLRGVRVQDVRPAFAQQPRGSSGSLRHRPAARSHAAVRGHGDTARRAAPRGAPSTPRRAGSSRRRPARRGRVAVVPPRARAPRAQRRRRSSGRSRARSSFALFLRRDDRESDPGDEPERRGKRGAAEEALAGERADRRREPGSGK